MNFGAFIAQITPGGVGIWTGVAMLAAWMLREWRENRKLSDADKQARRQGYEKEVAELRTLNRELRADMAKAREEAEAREKAAREEHDRYRALCQQETDALRAKMLHLEFENAGMKRRLDTMALEMAALATSPPSPDMERMAVHIDRMIEGIKG